MKDSKSKALKIKHWQDNGNKNAIVYEGRGNSVGRSGTSYPPYMRKEKKK